MKNKTNTEEKNLRLVSTAPVCDKEKYGEYADILHQQVMASDVYNIGVIAPYGAGKSSLIKTYKDTKYNWFNRKKVTTISLANTQIKNERQYSVEEYSQQNRNANGLIYNNSCLLRSSRKRVLDWQELRDYVLRNPTVKYVDDRYFKLYYRFDTQQSGYSYAVGENFKISDIKLNTYADMLQVSQHDCGLSRMLEVYEVRKMFEENKFATIWKRNDYIMTPSLYNQIYKGALGEVVGKCILDRYLDDDVEEIEDYSLYELFDFKIKNVYIDFKHWKGSPAKLKPQIEKIKRKLNRVKGEKAVIINILKRGNHKVFLNADGDVLEIPYLINDENEVDLNMLEEIEKLIICD